MTDISNEAYLIIDKAIDSGNIKQAIQFAESRIQSVPSDPYGTFWLGVSLIAEEHYSESYVAFKRSLNQDPEHYGSLAYLAYAKTCLCDWSGLDEIIAKLFLATDDDFANGKLRYIDPNIILPFAPSLQFQKNVAISRARYFHETKPTLRMRKNLPGYGGLLKIGYISADFTSNEVGTLIRDIFSLHDADDFITYCYCTRGGNCEIQSMIETSVNHFVDVSTVTDFELARRINLDGINILIDLNGYNKGGRPRVLAMQPADVQCQLLGQTYTMGAKYVQAILTHSNVVPKSMQESFSEKVYYLEETPFATMPFTNISELKSIQRSDYGLPEQAFVYCCFCEPCYITEDLFIAWMEILRETENSVLWLYGGNLKLEENLQAVASANGVDPRRIIFTHIKNLTVKWHHRLADVWLDTFVYSEKSYTTLSLWAGLPIIAFNGNLPQARVAATCCKLVGLKDLITDNRQQYVQTAIDICKDKSKLELIKQQLLAAKEQSPLFHPEPFIKNLEQLYKKMWQDFYAP